MTDTSASQSAPAASAAAPTAIDNAVAAAKDLPDLVSKAQAIDPSLAAALEGKALIASKTPWGTLLAGAIAYFAAKQGFGWDETLCDLLAGAGVLLGSYLMRFISPARITGLLKK